MWITSLTSKALTPNGIALGNFDGIHLGHRQVVQPILYNHQNNNCYKTVVTFNPHPQEFFSGESKKLLTPLSEKADQLELLGVEQLILLPFDRELASLSPQDFVKNILIKELNATFISVGEDFRFGHQRSGTAKDLKLIASKFNIDTYITPLKTNEDKMRISSSFIRKKLSEGNIDQVTQLLGRNYTLTGTVVSGKKLGRTIGFPTANIEVSSLKFIPRQGVYSVKVLINNHKSSNSNDLNNNWTEKILTDRFQYFPSLLSSSPLIKGVMNIGTRPTVEGKKQTIEVHLLNWQGNIYGHQLIVSLEKFLRPEKKFSSLEELKKQIKIDCEKSFKS